MTLMSTMREAEHDLLICKDGSNMEEILVKLVHDDICATEAQLDVCNIVPRVTQSRMIILALKEHGR